MKLYLINFENNIPVSAHEVEDMSKSKVEIELNEDKKTIKWMTILGNSEQDAMKVANKVAENIKDYL